MIAEPLNTCEGWSLHVLGFGWTTYAPPRAWHTDGQAEDRVRNYLAWQGVELTDNDHILITYVPEGAA